MADLSVYKNRQTFSDYQGQNQDINAQRAMTRAQIDALKQKALVGDDPSSVREWNYYNQLPQEDQQRYLQMKRADQIMNLGGQMAVRNPLGGVMESYEVTPKTVDMPEFQASQERAKTGAKLEQTARTEAQLGLGQVQSKAQQAKETISKLKSHPGFTAVVGMRNPFKGAVPFTDMNAPGSPASGAQALIDQIKGKSFLEAFESLKGGGQITEMEGQAATQAIARLNQAQSEKDFLDALADLEAIIDIGLQRQQQKAGVVNNPNLPPVFQGLPTEESLYQKSERKFNEGKQKVINYEDLPDGR